MPNSQPGPTDRALNILWQLSLAENASIRSIEDVTGISRSAIHRILQVFAEHGFAVKGTDGSYSVGPKLVQISARVISSQKALNIADSVMRELVEEIDETVYLASFNAADLLASFVHSAESKKPVRYIQPVGTIMPLYAGAAGKAILAHLAADVLNDISLERFTEATITSKARLRDELATIRARGYAVSIEERVPGAGGVAAPLIVDGVVVGSLTITVPTTRIPDGGLDEFGFLVRRYADELSRSLSGLALQLGGASDALLRDGR